jgi:mRNA interferase MazF
MDSHGRNVRPGLPPSIGPAGGLKKGVALPRHGRPIEGTNVERGEVWWAVVGDRCPVVLLTGDAEPDIRAIQIVAPATAEQKRGFTLLSGEQVTDPGAVRLATSPANMVGVEVEFGTEEGLPFPGVVRVALPLDGHIFCTGLVTLTRESLVERAGMLSPAKLDQLAAALRLARIEYPS